MDIRTRTTKHSNCGEGDGGGRWTGAWTGSGAMWRALTRRRNGDQHRDHQSHGPLVEIKIVHPVTSSNHPRSPSRNIPFDLETRRLLTISSSSYRLGEIARKCPSVIPSSAVSTPTPQSYSSTASTTSRPRPSSTSLESPSTARPTWSTGNLSAMRSIGPHSFRCERPKAAGGSLRRPCVITRAGFT